MNVIKVFRHYMEEQHPHLAYKDWKVDVKAISADDIRNGELGKYSG